MGTAISIALFTYGAILTITRLTILGIDLGLAGVGLMFVGAIGVVVTRPWRQWEPARRPEVHVNGREIL